MARRSKHGPDALKGMIVDAAEAILAADGLDGLTARALAERVACSPGTLYNVFANLDEVVLNVEARLLDRLSARIADARPEARPRDAVLQMAEIYLDFSHEFPRLWSILLEHALPAGQATPDWHRARLSELLGAVEARLVPMFAPGQQTEAALAARVLWAGVHGICSLSVADKLTNVTAQSARVLIRDLVETYLRGIEARRPPLLPGSA